MITSSRPMRGWRAVSTCVDAGVHGAHVGRAREQHGRLLAAPLLDLVRARQLAGAVQRGRGAEVPLVHGSPAVRPDGRHAGVVGHVVRVAHAHAGDVGDRVGRPGRELPDDEAVVACAHRPKLAGTH